jgi:hypothetical protein
MVEFNAGRSPVPMSGFQSAALNLNPKKLTEIYERCKFNIITCKSTAV